MTKISLARDPYRLMMGVFAWLIVDVISQQVAFLVHLRDFRLIIEIIVVFAFNTRQVIEVKIKGLHPTSELTNIPK